MQLELCIGRQNCSPPGGLEPPTFRLTAERASRLRHGGFVMKVINLREESLIGIQQQLAAHD